MANSMTIPKIIHSMWYDKIDFDNETPPSKHKVYPIYEMSWRQHHPDYQFHFWNRKKIEELWRRPELAKWKPRFDSLARLIEKCDYSRYAILYIYGGIYHDLDYLCFKNFDDLLNKPLLLSREPIEHIGMRNLLIRDQVPIGNCILGSAPNHPFWIELLDYIDKNYKK